MSHGGPTIRTLVVVFIALLVLLVLTVVANAFDLGRLNFLIAVAIATVKAVVIMLYFMEIRYSYRLMWVVSAAGFLWLLLLIGISMSDYLTRAWV